MLNTIGVNKDNMNNATSLRHLGEAPVVVERESLIKILHEIGSRMKCVAGSWQSSPSYPVRSSRSPALNYQI